MNYTYTVLAALAAASLSSCHTTLYNAAREGDVKTVREELADGADINKGASKANLIWQVPATVVAVPIDAAQIAGIPCLVTPIAYVLLFGENGSYQGKLKFLTKAVTEFGSETPMQAATNPDVITELLLAGAQGSAWDKTKALSEAARKGDAVILRKLLEKSCKDRADWNNENDYKPLMIAIGAGHEECARILLEHGANFSSYVLIGGKAITCYDYASAKGQLALYKKLGGPMAEAPESIAGKKIYFDYKSSKCGYDLLYESLRGNGKVDLVNNSYSISWSTSAFDKNNDCIDEYDNEKYGYKKTGKNTAEFKMYSNGSTAEKCYELKFKTNTSGAACIRGRDWGRVINEENIRFTIK